MARQRKDEYVPELLIESTFATEPSWTGELTGSISNVDLSSVKTPMIEDESYTTDGGTHERIEGLAWSNVSVPMSMKAEGLQVSPADGVTAIDTFQTTMVSLAMQQAPNLTDTDTIAAAPAPAITGFDFVTAASQSAAGIVMVPYEVSTGVYEARPATVSGTTITFLMDASAVPSAADDVLGASQIQYVWNPTDRSASMRFVGNDSLQHRYMQGVVAGLNIPEFGPGDVPMMDFTLQAAAVQQNPGADVRATPTTPRGRVFAGGEIRIGAYGTSTTPLSICGSRIAITNLGGGFLADECGNATLGVASWGVRPKGPVQVQVTFPHDVIPSAISGNTSASWYEALRTGGSESLFHLMFTLGQNVPAYSQSWYFPKLRLVETNDGEVNEQDARVCVFEAATGLTSTETQATVSFW